MTTPVGGASVFGGLGKLEIAPANGPEDPFPYYVDITPYVRAEQTDLQIARGRDSNLNAFQPGQLTCALDNSTFVFTPGRDPRVSVASDGFNRTVANGWGTADTGQTWTIDAGPSTDFSVAPTNGVIVPSVQGSARLMDLALGLPNAEVLLDMMVPSFSGGQVDLGAVLRGDNVANAYYIAAAIFDPSGSVTLVIRSLIGGVTTDLVSVVTSLTSPAGKRFRLRFNAFGPILRSKIWLAGTTEPSAWTLTVVDYQLTAGGRVGVYVRDDSLGAGTTFQFPAFAASNTGVLGGNALAPGMKVRYTETIGSRTFTEFTGWVEYPDVQDWRPIGYQEVQLTATDRLARLARGRTFVSTLAEHIIYNGGSNLTHYFPLNEAAGPVLRDVVGGSQLTQSPPQFFPPQTGTTVTYVTYAAGPAVTADDTSGVKYDYAVDGTGAANSYIQHQATLPQFTIASGQTVTLACWVNWTRIDTNNGPSFLQLANAVAGVPVARIYAATHSPGTNTYRIFAQDDTSTNSAFDVVESPQQQFWAFIAVRMTENTGLVEWWQNADAPQTFNLSGPSTATFNSLVIGTFAAMTMAHLQIYVGGYTRAQHLAQFQMGALGLEAQTTGQRVNTILNYAGVGANDRSVDPGVSYMAKATLAGRSPADVLAEAVTTEQGRGFAAGDGRYIFHDRQRVMNV